MDLVGCWLDVIALAMMLTGIRNIPWFKYLDPHCMRTADNHELLTEGMGFLMALLGLRLLVRRSFRHNELASKAYSNGIRLMTLGAFVFMAAMVSAPLYRENGWLTAVCILLVLLGGWLMCSGYMVALYVAMLMASE